MNNFIQYSADCFIQSSQAWASPKISELFGSRMSELAVEAVFSDTISDIK
jgi:hypothetical protein|tara:strand:+ start:282 stop:431 length:150 start_codon:yes stop_codon:yes gene_type:complete